MGSVQTTIDRRLDAEVITRSAEKASFSALHFSSWQQVARALGISSFAGETVISDLSQGAWKGHWIAHELQLQLGLPHSEGVQPLLNQGNYADTVGTLIDNESEGDKNFTLALKNCIQIRKSLEKEQIRHVLVIPPGNGFAWEEENLQLMELFFHAKVDVTLLCQPGAVLPENWSVHYKNQQENPVFNPVVPFFPGIVSPETANAFKLDGSAAVLLRNGFRAVDPLLRSTTWNQHELDGLWSQHPHLSALFQLRFAQFPKREIIEGEAILRFAEGAYGIALRLLTELLTKTDDLLQRESIRAQMQNIRIALMDFEAAADEEDPSGEDLPDVVKASLNQSKGWGLVMTNEPALAETYFEKARTLLKEDEFPRLYLYLLNISALNKLRSGEMEAAFALEKRIEQTLDQQADRDWHITYVNNINQARLFKKAGNFDVAEQYYNRAFAINELIKNESDLLYTNFCFAQLEELKGNHERAFLYWLRTCIHWLSNPVPEALAPRVAQAILFKKLSHNKGSVEEISGKLLDSLAESCKRIGLEVETSSQVIHFSRPENTNVVPDLAVGQPGWGVMLSRTNIAPVYEGLNYSCLNSQVVGCLQTLVPTCDWENYHTILADALFDSELPVTSSELLLLAMRFNIQRLIFNNKGFSLGDEDAAQLSGKIKASISPAIRFVGRVDNGLMVYFRRYKSPVVLDARETELLQYAQDHEGEPVVAIADWKEFLQLAQKRVIQLYL